MKPARYHVLVAEDDEDDRYFLTNVFRHISPECSLTFVGDGLELLDTLALGLSAPELILLDLNMPRMNGLEVLSHLKGEMGSPFAKIPVVVFSTSEDQGHKKQVLGLGADQFVTKPSKLVDMHKLIIQWRNTYLEGKYAPH